MAAKSVSTLTFRSSTSAMTHSWPQLIRARHFWLTSLLCWLITTNQNRPTRAVTAAATVVVSTTEATASANINDADAHTMHYRHHTPQSNNHANISELLDNLLRGYDNSIRPGFGGEYIVRSRLPYAGKMMYGIRCVIGNWVLMVALATMCVFELSGGRARLGWCSKAVCRHQMFANHSRWSCSWRWLWFDGRMLVVCLNSHRSTDRLG